MDAPDHPLASWLALLHTPGFGSRRFNRVLRQGVSPQQLLSEPDRFAESGLREALRQPDWAAVEQDLKWLEGPHRHLLALGDADYPPLLAETDDPPPLLFVVGDPQLLSQPQLAMVGSRNPSASGRQTAADFATHLSRNGLIITSGLATGIDGASHQGALQAGGPTLAVMGTGPDRIYPARHRELAHRIAEKGALISEFAPGTAPKPGHFPRRNRIISGLSLGTLVVEAALKSGSLITARLAAEQGREVFAIPGSIHNPLARGCHALIRQGAKLVERADDILIELAPRLGPMLAQAEPDEPQQPTVERADSTFQNDPEYRRLLQNLGYDPQPIDQIIERSGLTAESVSSMLLLLELEGRVAAHPGSRYCLTGSG